MQLAKSIICFSLFIGLVVMFSSCASAPKVTRMDSREVVDLSGNWNDTDSQQVSEAMINDAFSRPWVEEFAAKQGKKPRVIIGTVLNKSHEHINTQTFVKDLQRAMINSNKVFFVASSEQRDEIRAERIDQAKHASAETAKAAGNETGADYMLKGQINTIMDEAGKTKLKYYQVELEMLSVTNNEIVWVGQKKIKKVVKR